LRTYSIFGFGWLMIQELVISEKNYNCNDVNNYLVHAFM
jgi:hypothetical protein